MHRTYHPASTVLSICLLIVLLAQPALATAGSAVNTTSRADAPLAAQALLTAAGGLAAGYHHTCAITASGGVQCWGYNIYGQLGDGTVTQQPAPVDVTGLTNGATLVGGGDDHTCAVVSGRVKCWGRNSSGQLGDGTTANRRTPVDVVGMGLSVQGLAVGSDFACAITQAGGARCWGLNSYGQLGNGSPGTQLTAVDVVGLSSGVKALAAGTQHACALLEGGVVRCWGANTSGQLGNGTTTNQTSPVDVIGLAGPVKALTAGNSHTCAVLESGGVQCWGHNYGGQLGDDSLTNRATPVNVIGLSGRVVHLAGGGSHTCAVLESGGMQCWGSNNYGILGDGSTTRSTIPTTVQGLGGAAVQAAAGFMHTCARLDTGALQCWGHNGSNQLGNGTTTNSPSPVTVIGYGGFLSQGDTTPPAAVTAFHSGLGTVSGSMVSTLLSWNAPGDDGSGGGRAAQYDIRHSTQPISEANWGSAAQLNGEPAPADPGTPQQINVTGIPTSTRYYFAMKTADEENNWSALSNVPSLLDTGFRSSPQGFEFLNYGSGRDGYGKALDPSYELSNEDMRRLFGDDAVCIMENGSCRLRKEAELWRDIARENLAEGGGHCLGISHTALDLFRGVRTPGSFESGASTTYALKFPTSLQEYIGVRQVYQDLEPYNSRIKQHKAEDTPVSVLNGVRAALASGQTNRVVLVLCGSAGCHAVVPYAVIDFGSNQSRIWVYDNNHPFRSGSEDWRRSVLINEAADTWSYFSSLGNWSGTAASHTLTLLPAATYEGTANMPFRLGDFLPTTVWIGAGTNVLITDSQGRRLGWSGDTFLNEIPGADYTLVIEGSGNPVYSLPPEGTYTVHANGQDGAGELTYGQFGAGYAISIRNPQITATTQDQIILSPNGEGVRYQPNEASSADLAVAFDNGAASVQVEVAGLPVGADQSLSLIPDPANNQVVLRNDQTQAGTYTLNIETTSASGETTFTHNSVDVSAGDVHTILLDTAAPSDPVTVQVDHGGNGSVDETLELENEAPLGIFLPALFR